jgi:phage N-6-adenine-methyltransferase
MSDIEKAVTYLNNQDAAMWSIPPEVLPDFIEAHPEEAKGLVGSTERVAVIAAELRQWEAMQQAVRFLIACQQAVLDWWGGKVRPWGDAAKSQDRGISVAEAQKTIGFSDSAISRWRTSLRDPEGYEAELTRLVRRKAGLEAEPNRVTPNSGAEEWYTPAKYIEAAREVMGGIDLDPATCAEAQAVVQAAQWYSREDDGLSLSWHGRVWLNPPYSYPAVEQFTAKLCAEVEAGAVDQAIMVVNNCTDTGWFHATVKSAAVLCFTLGRIPFLGPGAGSSPLQGQAFFYFGDCSDEFRRVFSQFGFVR